MSLRIGNVMSTGSTVPQQIAAMHKPTYTAGPSMGGLQQLQQARQQAPEGYTPEQIAAGQGAVTSLMDQLKGWLPQPVITQAPRGKYYASSTGYRPINITYGAGSPDMASKMPAEFFDNYRDYLNFTNDLTKYYADAIPAANLAIEQLGASAFPGVTVKPGYQLSGLEYSIMGSKFTPENLKAAISGAVDPKKLNEIVGKYITPEELQTYAKSVASNGAANIKTIDSLPRFSASEEIMAHMPQFVKDVIGRYSGAGDVFKAMQSTVGAAPAAGDTTQAEYAVPVDPKMTGRAAPTQTQSPLASLSMPTMSGFSRMSRMFR